MGPTNLTHMPRRVASGWDRCQVSGVAAVGGRLPQRPAQGGTPDGSCTMHLRAPY